MKLMAAMAHLGFLFFLSVGVTVSTEVDLHKRIVGGHVCAADESQHHVKLISRGGPLPTVCGGSLIRDQWILTAAHCLEAGWTIEAKFHGDPSVTTPVKIVATPLVVDDIMLLKLPNPIKNIKPIPLPDCNTDVPKMGEEFHISGYGRHTVDAADKFTSDMPDKLQCVSMNFVDCGGIKTGLANAEPNIPFENFLCGKTPKKDSAPGDSGGGVVYKGKLHGVIHGGHDTYAFHPFGILRVCKYIDWIQNALKP